MGLHFLYPEASWIFDIEVFDEFGEGHWAQARFLVHGYEDVLWTNDIQAAAAFMIATLEAVSKERK